MCERVVLDNCLSEMSREEKLELFLKLADELENIYADPEHNISPDEGDKVFQDLILSLAETSRRPLVRVEIVQKVFSGRGGRVVRSRELQRFTQSANPERDVPTTMNWLDGKLALYNKEHGIESVHGYRLIKKER